MNIFQELTSQYSIVEIIVICFGVCLVVKAAWDLASFFISKARNFFQKEHKKEELLQNVDELKTNTITKEEHEELIQDISIVKEIINNDTINNERHEEVLAAIKNLSTDIGHLEQRVNFVDKALSEEIKVSKERDDSLQEYQVASTRRYLVDAHHLHCYERHFIDEQTLDSLEKMFDMYHSRGGNSYIENCMQELRSLPRICNMPELTPYPAQQTQSFTNNTQQNS